MNNRKSKFWTVLLSVVPGAGHMYMGYINQGAQLMLLFFVICSLVAYFRLELLGFVLPVIWFYSVFDAYHLNEGSNVEEISRFNVFSWLQEHPKMLGWLLVFLGAFMLLDRVLLPLISYPWQYYIQSGIVALILIWGGIKLLTGTRIEAFMPEESGSAQHNPDKASFPVQTVADANDDGDSATDQKEQKSMPEGEVSE